MSFVDEAKTYLAFPSDSHFCRFRTAVEERYVQDMATVKRNKVYADGHTVATLSHASNLGAELRGLAYQFGGSSETTYTKG